MAKYQLTQIPEDVHDIIKDEQARKLTEKKVLISKENIIYQIIKEWKKLKSGNL